MTTDLEKQFYTTFGIEPYDKYITCKDEGYCDLDMPCDCCIKGEEVYCYPTITDRILLELICIATASEITVEFKGIKNVEHLKEVVLNYCIERYGYCLQKDKFKHQVQALFKEER